MAPVPVQPVQQAFYESSGATTNSSSSASNLPGGVLSATQSATQPVQQVSHESPAPSSHEPPARSSSDRAAAKRYDQGASPSAASLPLRPSSNSSVAGGDARGSHTAADDHPLSPVSSLTTALSGLAIVLGLFFLASWLLKRTMPKSARTLPSEVLEVLGRTSLAARQSVHLVRVGRKLILISVSTDGIETLTEITDPSEVDRLAGICAEQSSESSSSAFANVFQQFQRESTSLGFLGADGRSGSETANARVAEEGRDG